MKRSRLAGAFGAAVLAVAVAAGCTSGKTDNNPPNNNAAPTYNSSGQVLNIVAGSEHQAVFDAIVKPWCTQQKVTCNYTKMGSVDEYRLLSGSDPKDIPYDAFWFASSVWQNLGDQGHKLQDAKPMFVSPIVFAGWKSEMDKLGFSGGKVTIQQVLDAVEGGKTKVWLTNPTQSNSGSAVLLGYMNYFAGNEAGVPLTAEQLNSDKVKSGITRFAQAFDHVSPSNEALLNECVANSGQCKTLFTYETLIIQKNKELVAQGHEPLVVAYPQGSLAIADAPLGFLPHGSNPEKEATFKKLQDYMLSADVQKQLLTLGRRPIGNIGLCTADAPQDVFNPAWGVQSCLHQQPITYPAAPVIKSALDNYNVDYRRPGRVVYCIDGSGSMADNGGWNGVKQAAGLLFDPAQSSQVMLQVGPQDATTVLLFSDKIKNGNGWTVNGNAAGQLVDLKNKIQGSGPNGGTAIYDCLGKAADQFKGADANHRNLVILMTDGENTNGGKDGLNTIKAAGVPVVAVGFGNQVDEGSLKEIASQTGGVYIKANDVAAALRQATSYR